MVNKIDTYNAEVEEYNKAEVEKKHKHLSRTDIVRLANQLMHDLQWAKRYLHEIQRDGVSEIAISKVEHRLRNVSSGLENIYKKA